MVCLSFSTYPGKGGITTDWVSFLGNTNNNCIVDVPITVNSMFIKGYTGRIELKNTLTLSGVNVPAASSLQMTSAATIAGFGGARGSLVLAQNAVFGWQDGTLDHVTVDVTRTATTAATMTVQAIEGPGGNPTMLSAIIDVKGTLNWWSQNVLNGFSGENPRSMVHIFPGGGSIPPGEFDIRAGGNLWGVPVGGGPNLPWSLEFQNEGTVTVNASGTATLVGEYWNVRGGLTQLNTGTLELLGQAEQQHGTSTFELKAGSRVAISSALGILGIRDGTIRGSGTVQGTLVLGYDPNGPDGPIPANPAISPIGAGGAHGLITVTGNFQMFGGRMSVGIGGPQPPDYDRVVVNGYAALSAATRAYGVLNPNPMPIPAGTKIRFLISNDLRNPFGDAYPPGADWDKGWDPKSYWFVPTRGIGMAKVGGRVWEDTNPNGIQDDGEPSLAGVTVQVRLAGTNTVVASTATDPDGTYSFELPPKTYDLKVLRSGRGSPQDQTSDDKDSDFDEFTHMFTGLTLSQGQEVEHLDAGFPLGSTPLATIGGHVWDDTNGNGLQDSGETGLSDVLVELLDAYGNVVATAYTYSDGSYQFAEVAAGSYRIRVARPDGFAFSPKDQGSNDALDSDVDGSGDYGFFFWDPGSFSLDIDAGLTLTPIMPTLPGGAGSP